MPQKGMSRPPGGYDRSLVTGAGSAGVSPACRRDTCFCGLAPTPPTKDLSYTPARVAANDLREFQLNYGYWLLDFDPHRGDDPSADNGMSLLIGVDSAANPERVFHARGKPLALPR